MTRARAAFQKIRGYTWLNIPYLDDAEQYVVSGDAKGLRRVKPLPKLTLYWGNELADAVARPSAWTDVDRRVLHVLGRARILEALGRWLDDALTVEKPEEDFHGLLRRELESVEVPSGWVVELTVGHVANLARSGRTTSAGRYILDLPADDIRTAVRDIAKDLMASRSARVLELLLDVAPEKAAPVLGEFLDPVKDWGLPYCAQLVLDKAGARFEADVAAVLRGRQSTWTKFQVAVSLHAFAPEKYRETALAAARASLAGRSSANNHNTVGEWMIEHFGEAVLPEILDYLRKDGNDHFKDDVVNAAVEHLGRKALPAVLIALERGSAPLKLAVLPHLAALDDGSHRGLLQAEIRRGFQETDSALVLKFLAVAGRWDLRAVLEDLWALLEHKSKPVREEAARALGRVGTEVLDRAVELLSARRAPARLAAVTILATLNTPEALDALERRLEVEDDENVRDGLLLSLQEAWAKAGRRFGRADVDKRVSRVADKLTTPPASWINEAKLPGLRDAGGRALSRDEVRYLLYRQSRAKEMAADVEVAPLLALLDRKTTGDFALALLNGFLASGADAGDRWVLALAGLIGDDRIVPVLSRQIREWADNSRGKLAEYGVQAIALLGSDEALMAVDSFALRYRTKNKNIGKAAVDAFAAAADAQGVTPDELGDRVVPWLGFEASRPRVVEGGGKRIEVGVGTDFKLRFVEAESRKTLASLPKAVPKEVAQEIKDLQASLREVAKAQNLRLENLMVRQRRWPVSQWKTLFLEHPLLLPFAVQLVWGHYDDKGKRRPTFRALEDRTLTDADDQAVDVGASGVIGIVHPLELSEDERAAWQQHLADNETEPPFPQLARPVVRVSADQAALRSYKAVRGVALNAMTFKGRAERLGWQRGSVVDAGGITSYWKSFPASGADAFLGLDGMYIGIDMYASITLQDLVFVRGGSVTIGSYTYDDPEGEKDPRALVFGEVPPIVFSEVMGDLAKIAGQNAAVTDT
jgi:hypothetical protein